MSVVLLLVVVHKSVFTRKRYTEMVMRMGVSI